MAVGSPDAATYVRFLLVAGLGLVLDLWSKHWAFHTLRQGGEIEILPRVLVFQTMLNPGALFGIGQGQTTLFLVASVFALILVLWMFSKTSARNWALHIALGGILAGALGNMYDRATVRLIDEPVAHRTDDGRTVMVYLEQVRVDDDETAVLREYPPHADGVLIRRPVSKLGPEVGYVRDFIKIPTTWFGGRELWPWVFNVADMLLVGGVSILAFNLWFGRRDDEEVDAPDGDGAGPDGDEAPVPRPPT